MQVSEFVLGRRDSTVVKKAMVPNKAVSSGKGFILSGSDKRIPSRSVTKMMGLSPMFLAAWKFAIDDRKATGWQSRGLGGTKCFYDKDAGRAWSTVSVAGDFVMYSAEVRSDFVPANAKSLPSQWAYN